MRARYPKDKTLSSAPFNDAARITTLDGHTAGEPLRIVTSGFPAPRGATMLEKRADLRAHHDALRRAIMLEPRGHADMYGCLMTEGVTSDADIGVLFLHNEGYSTMCGHGIIGLVTLGLEAGLFQLKSKDGSVRIDTPAGRVTARPSWRQGRVTEVCFENVPSFVTARALRFTLSSGLTGCCDVAFGGAFYAYVDADALALDLGPSNCASLIAIGRAIKAVVAKEHPEAIRHPGPGAGLDELYGVIFVSQRWPDVHSRNVCVFADGEVDRSPTGTGVSGRAALHAAKGELAADAWIEIESIIGSRFSVRWRRSTMIGSQHAIVPEVSGAAFITGRHEFLLDPLDPLRHGFLLR
jgi:proline racemase